MMDHELKLSGTEPAGSSPDTLSSRAKHAVNDSKIECVKVRRPATHGDMWCVMPVSMFSLVDEFDGAELGERIELEYIQLCESELAAIPEFEGW